jgi:hypothetical protein
MSEESQSQQSRTGEENLTERKRDLEGQLKKARKTHNIWFIAGAVLLTLGLVELGTGELITQGDNQVTLKAALILVGSGSVIITAIGYVCRSRIRSIKEEMQDIDFSLDLLKLTATEGEIRAEKLLRMNQIELRRYYDLNLSQSSWIFAVGILCILAGIGIIGITLYLIRPNPAYALEWQEKAVLGFLGAVGTIFTDYVGSIYLHMHSETTKSLVALHSKLTTTNDLFLANLLASRINDTGKREDAWAQLATSIAESKDKTRETTKKEG